jgi:hypothetical protein
MPLSASTGGPVLGDRRLPGPRADVEVEVQPVLSRFGLANPLALPSLELFPRST